MNKPQRIQLSRKKHFRLQQYSFHFNGLPAKKCDRSTKYGNPFRLTPDGFIQAYSMNRNILDPWIMWSATGGFETKDILELYEKWLDGEFLQSHGWLPIRPDINQVRNHNLACWCSLDADCHVDVILEKLYG